MIMGSDSPTFGTLHFTEETLYGIFFLEKSKIMENVPIYDRQQTWT